MIRLLKWCLVAFGAVLWCALWFSRSRFLGMSQTILLGHLLSAELRPYLCRQRRHNS